MTTEIQGVDPYDAVIADLQAKRDQIDQTIALLTGLRGGSQPPIGYATATDTGITETAGMFLGMSIVDAGKKLLAMRKRTMGNAEIASELQKGGLVFSGKDPLNVVGSVLTRRFNDVGDVVKVGRGIWGLKEWYPGRNFKTIGKNVVLVVPSESEILTEGTEEVADGGHTDDSRRWQRDSGSHRAKCCRVQHLLRVPQRQFWRRETALRRRAAGRGDPERQ